MNSSNMPITETASTVTRKANKSGAQFIITQRAKDWLKSYYCDSKGYTLDLIPIIHNGIRYFSIYRFVKEGEPDYTFICITPPGLWKIDENLEYMSSVREMASWLYQRCGWSLKRFVGHKGIVQDCCKYVASHYNSSLFGGRSPYNVGAINKDNMLILAISMSHDEITNLKSSFAWKRSVLLEKEGIETTMSVTKHTFKF